MDIRNRLSLALLLAGSLVALPLVALPLVAAETAAPANPMPCAGAGPCGGAGPGAGAGPCQGGGPCGRGGWTAGPRNTPGFKLMTPEERTAHQAKMRSLKTMDECQTYVSEHRAAMVKRAQEQGKQIPQMRRDPCAMLKKRGMIQ